MGNQPYDEAGKRDAIGALELLLALTYALSVVGRYVIAGFQGIDSSIELGHS